MQWQNTNIFHQIIRDKENSFRNVDYLRSRRRCQGGDRREQQHDQLETHHSLKNNFLPVQKKKIATQVMLNLSKNANEEFGGPSEGHFPLENLVTFHAALAILGPRTCLSQRRMRQRCWW